jgi:uncharacterized sulfatase
VDKSDTVYPPDSEKALEKLKAMGELDNTLIVVSGDHGAAGFPRGKCNLHDFGVGVSWMISST